MGTYGVVYVDRNGNVKAKECRTEKALHTWVAKGLESGLISEIRAWAEPQS